MNLRAVRQPLPVLLMALTVLGAGCQPLGGPAAQPAGQPDRLPASAPGGGSAAASKLPPPETTPLPPPTPPPPPPPALPPPSPPTPPASAQPHSERVFPSTNPARAGARHALADVYVFMACASANNPGARWSEPLTVERGLASLVQGQLIPFYQQGWRRFYIDSPFGKDTDEKGDAKFTFFGWNKTAPDSPWRRGFVDAWRRATRLEGVRIIAYMGNPYADKEFRDALAGPGGRERAMAMLRAAVAPLVDAGFHGLGIDASADMPEDSPVADLMKELQNGGMEIYVESTPFEKQRWLTRFGTIRTCWFARGAPKFKGVLDVSESRGEKIQLYAGTAPWPEGDNKPLEEWVPRWVTECLDRGERPAMGVYWLKDPRRQLNLR